MKFTWKVSNYESQDLTVKLDFEKPSFVSSTTYKEELQIDFNEGSELYFVDIYGKPIQNNTETLLKEIPA